MSTTHTRSANGVFAQDAWAWWQSRRLGYNLALAVSGVAAYALAVAFFYAFHDPVWSDWRSAASMTLLLGIGFLVLMGAANVFYLLGPAVESWIKPPDADRFRVTAHRMGFWGSMALPFAFPLVILAGLISAR